MKNLIIPIAFLMSGCFSSIMDDEYTHIDPFLKDHVDSFVSEAAKRNIKIDTYGLKISLEIIKGQSSGRCIFETNAILIDTSKTNNVEALVFHELGHLYLHRGHDNIMYGHYCKSIMANISDPVYDKPYKREYYITELFNTKEPAPFWATGSVIGE
jgi:hypothetical protein